MNIKLILVIILFTFLVQGRPSKHLTEIEWGYKNKIENHIIKKVQDYSFYEKNVGQHEKNTPQFEKRIAEFFGIEKDIYKEITKDRYFSDEEIKYLYKIYYTPLPKYFEASGTYFGSDSRSIMELKYYGIAIRSEMPFGFVLVASGKYGYHDELLEELEKTYKTTNTLLSKEASPLYHYFADGGVGKPRRDSKNQPIPILYEELNDEQKRIFDLTVTKDVGRFLISPVEQSKFSEEVALKSGKYVGFVSCKSPNDIGRRFLLYQDNKFVGVVLVVGTAKLSDWTGYGTTTDDSYQWYNFPIGISTVNGQYIVFDLPETVYKYLGGTGEGIVNLSAIDPD